MTKTTKFLFINFSQRLFQRRIILEFYKEEDGLPWIMKKMIIYSLIITFFQDLKTKLSISF